MYEKNNYDAKIKKKNSNLSVINSNEPDKWYQTVKSFKNFDVYYMLDYVKAFKIHGDGEPILFYFEDENIRAMNVVMKRDISIDKRFTGILPPNTYYDLTTPYGYGGFIIEGNATEESLKKLDNEYISICRNKGIISEFVRFHPVLSNEIKLKNIYDISALGKTITIELDSLEHIWSNLTSKNRNVIRKAKKSNVNIYWGRNPELIEEFIKLYNATMDRDNAKDYYYFNKDFYKSLLFDLKYNSMIFYAVNKEKIISMSIILYSNNQMHYHLSATDREFQRLAPTNLLLYETACWGYENGYKTFHLGGGLGSQEDNLFKFKKAFNRNSDTTFCIGKKIFDFKSYKKLLDIRNQEDDFDNTTSYFPAYRV